MRKIALFWFGLVVTLLVSLGLIVLFSASQANSMRLYGNAFHFVKYQSAFVAAGVVAATCFALFDYRKWRDHPCLVWLLTAVVIILLLVVFRYPPVNGSRRWIRLLSLRIQPAEFAKLAIVFVLSMWLDRAGWRVELIGRGAFVPALIIGAFALPILLEPDFGSVMVIGLVGFIVMFVGGVRILHMLPFGILGAGVVVYKVATNANRMARIAAFLGIKLDIGADVVDAAAERAAYQAHQALVAIGNGGIWGVGMGQSMQKHYYLPEAHTDFIFAIGAEELGLLFSIAVILLYCAFFALSVYIARKSTDRFGRLLVLGMSVIIFFQAMFNIGVVCEALPTKGMALPFFSYGGTNMLSSFIAIGTIFSVGFHSYRDGKRSLARKVLMRA